MSKTARPAGEELKNVVGLISEADKWVCETAAEAEFYKSRIDGILNKLGERQTESVLRAMDIDCLNSGKQGLRISALRRAGISNMWQLCSLSRSRLVNISGIGEDNALRIYAAARRIRDEAGKGVRIRISGDDRSEEASELLHCINVIIERGDVISRCAELREAWHGNILQACRETGCARNIILWSFAGEAKRRLASDAYEYLRAALNGEFGRELNALMEESGAARILDKDECWQDFERRSAVYYSVLERHDGSSSVRLDNSRCGLPAELAQAVEEYPLHTDRLKATLRRYQEFGTKYILRQKRVLLGDEMGLGKTVQAIAAMVSLRTEGASHFLVVCPASVLVNWSREIKQFSDITATIIRGGDISAVRAWINNGGAGISTYDSISRFGLPEDFRFAMLIADEAHYVKNPMAKRSQYLKVLSRRAERLLFMTGTPLENRVDEMCHIVGLLNEDVAGEIKELKYISTAPQFREALAPVYLRRTREDVLQELPELIEKEQWCDMGAEEKRRYYLSVMSKNFMAMRQVSWDVRDIADSSKATRLLQLREMAQDEGRRLIVFSFFRDTIDRVCALLGNKCMEPITGAVSSVKRQEIIDAFSSSPAGTALVCQIQAGGAGLNIQAASVVIFCEPQIKPSLETQAISRAYRMGQIRNVIVHRLLCDNSVDERIMELLHDKQEIFDSFADVSAMGSEFIRNERGAINSIIEREQRRLNPKPDETVDDVQAEEYHTV